MERSSRTGTGRSVDRSSETLQIPENEPNIKRNGVKREGRPEPITVRNGPEGPCHARKSSQATSNP